MLVRSNIRSSEGEIEYERARKEKGVADVGKRMPIRHTLIQLAGWACQS